MTGILIPLATGFEEIEAVTIIDLLRRAEFNVTTCGIDAKHINGAHDITILCDEFFDNKKRYAIDAIVLPGGIPGVDNLAACHALNDLIEETAQANKLIAAICAAPAKVLYPLGLLEGKNVTGYPSTAELMPNAHYQDTPTVIDSNIITSQGVGSAIDFSLAIVEYLSSKAQAESLAKQIVHQQ